jgi:hypothetical protein
MHLQHFKKSDVKRLTNEYEREEELNNSDHRIDPSRTKDNYTMKPRRFHHQLDKDVEMRLNNVEHSNRKDLNVISTWIVTCPQELLDDPDKVKQFFSVAFDFMSDRYGNDNVLNGYVHMDETTPHMHVPIVPVSNGRVSAKAVFTRRELREFHADLDKRMQEVFGTPGLILNGRTKGNYTVEELKERTRKENELSERENNVTTRETTVANRASKLSAREKSMNERENSLNARETRLNARERRLNEQEQIIKEEKAKLSEQFEAFKDDYKTKCKSFYENKYKEDMKKIRQSVNAVNSVNTSHHRAMPTGYDFDS